MARPSTTSERRAQVLAAYVRAAARHGISGATLAVVAKEAQLARSLVRHHLGNKDRMFDLLVEHVVEETNRQTAQLAEALPQDARMEALIDHLFSAPPDPGPQLIFVFADLTMKAVTDRALASKLSTTFTTFEAVIIAELRRAAPAASDPLIDTVAHGIGALYFNAISLAPLGLEPTRAKRAATLLLQSLQTEVSPP